LFYHNNFVNNNEYDDYCSNTWDNGYPDGGNYWDGYTGVDEYSGPDQDQPGSDGIGDTPYDIPGGYVQDRYPLMLPVETPPNEPRDPTPENGVTGVSINAGLGWTGGDPYPGDTVTYDVYFETTNPPTTKVSANQSEVSYDPGTMNYDTTYYWTIVSWDNHEASTAGPLWSFTTQQLPPPAPTQVTDTTPWNIYAADMYKGIGGIPGRYNGQPASYQSTSTEPGSDLYFTFFWGDGNSTVVGPVSGSASATFAYGHWGTYSITVTVQHGPTGTSSDPSVARSVRMYKAGDVQCDDTVTFADIDPFVEALYGHAAWATNHPDRYWFTADCNFDHAVTFADIDPFVELLGT